MGARPSPTYQSWRAMITRCTSPSHPYYRFYGGSNVTVCDRWLTFANFVADMGTRPAGMTLDRFPDRTGNYEPGNCRWATWHEQSRNKSNTVYIEHEGRRLCITDWCAELGLVRNTVYGRIYRGKDPLEALGLVSRKAA